MRPLVLITLIAFNAIWSAHPAMSKLAMRSVSPAHAAWWRYSLALAAYLLLVPILRVTRGKQSWGPAFGIPSGRHARDRAWIFLLGFLTFCVSPLLTFFGLAASRATDNALIIAIEPLFVVLLARLLLGERLRERDALSLPLAVAGFFLLSGGSGLAGTGWDPRFWGNVLMAVSLVGEASFSVLGRYLTRRHAPLGIFGTALAFGCLLLTAAVISLEGVPDPRALSGQAWLGLLWLGPLGTTAGYLAWMVALAEAPVAAISVTLFFQPLMGTVWGVVFLDERLELMQWVGAVAILLALAAQVRGGRRSAIPVSRT